MECIPNRRDEEYGICIPNRTDEGYGMYAQNDGWRVE